jgi:LysM repeat protein
MAPAACPWLGLDHDPATHAQSATTAHRCFRDGQREYVVSEEHQRRCCVTSDFAECPGFRYGWRSVQERAEKRRLPSYLADSRRHFARPLRILGTFAVAGLIVFIVVHEVMGAPHANDSVAAANSATRTPVLAAPAGPVQAQPLATATAAIPTPTAPPSPTPPTIYLVRAGDSYSLIARNFNVSLDQLLQVNHRTVDSMLYAGDRLIVP